MLTMGSLWDIMGVVVDMIMENLGQEIVLMVRENHLTPSIHIMFKKASNIVEVSLIKFSGMTKSKCSLSPSID